MKEIKKKYAGFCKTCRKEVQIIPREELDGKLKPIKRSSAKGKGMGCQVEVRDMISERLGIPKGDVLSTSSGQTGTDIKFSDAARKSFPFHAVEVARQQSLNVWAKFAQCLGHSERQKSGKEPGNGRPILIFRKNHTELFAKVRFSDLLDLILACDKKKLAELCKE